MKNKFAIVLLFWMVGFASIAKSKHDNVQLKQLPILAKGFKNGWYDSTINYSNYSTGHLATVNMHVYVEHGFVTKIDLGNGKSIHADNINSDYMYSGGNLNFERENSNGKITSAKTTVSILNKDGTSHTFNISI